MNYGLHDLSYDPTPAEGLVLNKALLAPIEEVKYRASVDSNVSSPSDIIRRNSIELAIARNFEEDVKNKDTFVFEEMEKQVSQNSIDRIDSLIEAMHDINLDDVPDKKLFFCDLPDDFRFLIQGVMKSNNFRDETLPIEVRNCLKSRIEDLNHYAIRYVDRVEVMDNNKSWVSIFDKSAEAILNRMVKEWIDYGTLEDPQYFPVGKAHELTWRGQVNHFGIMVEGNGKTKKVVLAEMNRKLFLISLIYNNNLFRDITHWQLSDLKRNVQILKSTYDSMFQYTERFISFIDIEFISFKEHVYYNQVGYTIIDKISGSIYNGSELLKSIVPLKIFYEWKNHSGGFDIPVRICEISEKAYINEYSSPVFSLGLMHVLSDSLIVVKGGSTDIKILRDLNINSPVFDLGTNLVRPALIPVSTKSLKRMCGLIGMDIHDPKYETYLWAQILVFSNKEITFNSWYEICKFKPRPLFRLMPSDGHCALYLVHQIYCSRPYDCAYYKWIDHGLSFDFNKPDLLKCCVLDPGFRNHLLLAQPDRYNLSVLSKNLRLYNDLRPIDDDYCFISHKVNDVAHLGYSFSHRTGARYQARVPDAVIEDGYAGANCRPIGWCRIFLLILLIFTLYFMKPIRASVVSSDGPVFTCDTYATRYLQLPETFTFRDIARHYKKLSLLYHPDKQNGSEEKMEELNDIYMFLTQNPCGDYLSKDTKLETIVWEFRFERTDPNIFTFIFFLAKALFLAWISNSILIGCALFIAAKFVDSLGITETYKGKSKRVIITLIFYLVLGIVSYFLMPLLNQLIRIYLWQAGYGAKKNKKKDLESSVYEDTFKIVKVGKDLKRYSITEETKEELVDGKKVSYIVHWMPTEGYCAYTVAMVYLYLNRIQNIAPTYQWDILRIRHLFNQEDDTSASVIFFDLIHDIIDRFNLKNKAILNINEVQEFFTQLDVRGSHAGSVGVVVSPADRNGVKHFGILSQWSPVQGKNPIHWCSWDVQSKHPNIEDIYNKSVYADRGKTAKDKYMSIIKDLRDYSGNEDVMVEFWELEYVLRNLSIPYTLRTKSGEKYVTIRTTKSNGALHILHDEDNVHYSIDHDYKEQEPSDFQGHSIRLRLKAEEETKATNEKSVDDKKITDHILDLADKYGIKDLTKTGGNTPFLTYHWSSDMTSSSVYKGEFLYIDQSHICISRDRAHQYPRAKSHSQQDYRIGAQFFRTIEFMKFNYFVVCVRVNVTDKAYIINDRLWRYELRKQFASSEKHENYIKEWFNLNGKPELVRRDLKSAVCAVRLYLASATNVFPTADFVATHLVILLRELDETNARYENLVDNNFLYQYYVDKRDILYSLVRCMYYDVYYPSFYYLLESPIFIRFLYVSGVYGGLWYACLDLLVGYWYWMFHLYFAVLMVPGVIVFIYSVCITITDLTTRDDLWNYGARARMGFSSFSSLFDTVNMSDNIYVQTTCYIKGEVSNYYSRLRKLLWERPVRNLAPISYSKRIPLEFRKYLARFAPSDTLAGLHCIAKRQFSPAERVKPTFERFLDNNPVLEEFKNELTNIALAEEPTEYEEFLKDVDGPKKRLYAESKLRFWEWPIWKNTYDAIFKSDETQFKIIEKPRLVGNPPGILKGVGAWVMRDVLRYSKMTKSWGESICCGKNQEEVESVMTAAYKRIEDPLIFTCDGAQWDSHQSHYFINSFDNYVLKAVLPIILRKQGMGPLMVNIVTNGITSLWRTLNVKFNDKRFPRGSRALLWMKVKFLGLVMSGNPSATTWGNTNRALCFYKTIFRRHGYIWGVDVIVFQAGDDTFAICRRPIFGHISFLIKYYGKKYGLVFKDFKYDLQSGDFLSNDIFFSGGQFHMYRKPNRLISTGLKTEKAKPTEMEEFDYAITLQLASYGKQIIGISPYVQDRFNRCKAKNPGKFLDIVNRINAYSVNNYQNKDPYEGRGYRDQYPLIHTDYKRLDCVSSELPFLVQCCS